MDKNIEYYSSRLSELRSYFENKKKTFKELRNYLAPNTGMFEDEMEIKQKDQFLQKNINTMPHKYNEVLATMLNSNFTSPSVKWFKLGQRDVLKPTRDERKYFQDVETTMYNVFEDSNLNASLFNVYLEAQTYGTGASYKVKNYAGVIKFRPLTIGEYFIDENSAGVVDVMYRYMNLDLRKLVQMFGIENIPAKYANLAKQGKYGTYVKVWHAVEPNEKFLEAWENDFNKPYISCYFIDGERDGIIEIKGMSYFPYFVARWNKFANDPYGVGIGIQSIGDIKMLQKYERDLAKASSKKILPLIKLPTAFKNQKTNISDGKPIYSDVKDAASPVFQVNYDTREARENINTIQDRIFKYFYNDVFFAMLNADKTMSATEAAARNSEKMQMLGGIVTRWQKEFLEPILETTYKFLGERNKLPELPESLQGREIDIDYHGLTFQSMDMADLANLERYLVYGSQVAAISPGALDSIDGDQLMEYGARKMDTPIEVIRSPEQVEAIRAQRAEQAAQAQAKEKSEALRNTAAATKDLSDAGTTGDNALASLMGG